MGTGVVAQAKTRIGETTMAATAKKTEDAVDEQPNPAVHEMTRAEAKHWRDQQKAHLAIEAVKQQIISAKEARAVLLPALGLPADPE